MSRGERRGESVEGRVERGEGRGPPIQKNISRRSVSERERERGDRNTTAKN